MFDHLGHQAHQFYQTQSFQVQPSAPLIHPFFPQSFNMSAGLVQLEPYIRKKKQVDQSKIVTIQNCVRYYDQDVAGHDCNHLTFFKMWGALMLGKDIDRKSQIEQLWQLLTQIFNLNKEKMVVTVFKGGKVGGHTFGQDQEILSIWQQLGLKQDQIFMGDETEVFWLQSGMGHLNQDNGLNERLCGYQTEVFYDLTGSACGADCSPFCDCGRFLEIANSLDIRWLLDDHHNLQDLSIPATETVIGLERLAMILNNITNVWLLPQWQPYWSLLSANIKKEDQRVILDRMRILIYLSMERIPKPDRNGRGRLVRSFLRDILSRLYLYTGADQEVRHSVKKLAETMANNIQQFYPKVADTWPLVVESLMRHHRVYQETIRHAQASIKHSLLRGEIKQLDQVTKLKLRQSLGIPIFLIDHYFQNKY